MASNGVRSEKLNYRLPFVAHERLCLSSLIKRQFLTADVDILRCEQSLLNFTIESQFCLTLKCQKDLTL